MFLAVDIGNTNITCGIYDKGNWVDIIRIPSDPIYLNRFKYFNKYPVSDCSISSVCLLYTSDAADDMHV